ncbi:hypothetical protein GCM10025734_72700 [Kitasatospora paranensis]
MTTHCIPAADSPSSRMMLGAAMDTMVWSMKVIDTANSMPASARDSLVAPRSVAGDPPLLDDTVFSSDRAAGADRRPGGRVRAWRLPFREELHATRRTRTTGGRDTRRGSGR